MTINPKYIYIISTSRTQGLPLLHHQRLKMFIRDKIYIEIFPSEHPRIVVLENQHIFDVREAN